MKRDEYERQLLAGEGFIVLARHPNAIDKPYSVRLYRHDELARFKSPDDPLLPHLWWKWFSVEQTLTYEDARELSRLPCASWEPEPRLIATWT